MSRLSRSVDEFDAGHIAKDDFILSITAPYYMSWSTENDNRILGAMKAVLTPRAPQSIANCRALEAAAGRTGRMRVKRRPGTDALLKVKK